MVSFTKKEALEVIESLVRQMITGNPNSGRVEFSNPYFSVVIEDE